MSDLCVCVTTEACGRAACTHLGDLVVSMSAPSVGGHEFKSQPTFDKMVYRPHCQRPEVTGSVPGWLARCQYTVMG